MILWTVTVITLNRQRSTSRPQVDQSLDQAARKAADGRVHQQQTLYNLTKTRGGINCGVHRFVSTHNLALFDLSRSRG